jgi:hypothetical protein
LCAAQMDFGALHPKSNASPGEANDLEYD